MPPDPDPVDPDRAAAIERLATLAGLWERDLYADIDGDMMILDLLNQRVIWQDGRMILFLFDPTRVDDSGRIHGLLTADGLEDAPMTIAVLDDAIVADITGQQQMTFRRMPMSRQLLGRWWFGPQERHEGTEDGASSLIEWIEFGRSTVTVKFGGSEGDMNQTCRYRIEKIDGNLITVLDIDRDETMLIWIDGDTISVEANGKAQFYYRGSHYLELRDLREREGDFGHKDSDDVTTDPPRVDDEKHNDNEIPPPTDG